MRRIQIRRWLPAALLLAVVVITGRAEDIVIQSFDGTGQLTFNRIAKATVYWVEWAPSPAGPWTNFWDAAVTLNTIPQFSGGSYTSSVPMCYRVVASVTNTPVPNGMVLIPKGTNSGTDPDFGAYWLNVADDFYMDRYEVTKTLWDEVRTWASSNGYTDLPAGGGKAANHPVNEVSWYDCVKWCNARSQEAGLTPVYYSNETMTLVYTNGNVLHPYVNTSANGYRLPTDTQWHYAARGGVANRRFAWGDVNTIQHTRANYNSSSLYTYDTSTTRGYHPTYDSGGFPYTSPVGAFAPNGYGLYDMIGNVWEWCFDWYPGHEGTDRVIRGGGWSNTAKVSRFALRGSSIPSPRDKSYGFRTVLPLGQ